MTDDTTSPAPEQTPTPSTEPAPAAPVATQPPPPPPATSPSPLDGASEAMAAMEMLQAGQSPKEVNRALRSGQPSQRPGQATGTPSAQGAQPASSQPDGAPRAPERPTAEALGLTPGEFHALERAKLLDGAFIKSVPQTNLKSVARQLQASQAEADRQFQSQRKAPAATAGEQPTQPTAGAPIGAPTPSHPQQVPTQPETPPTGGQAAPAAAQRPEPAPVPQAIQLNWRDGAEYQQLEAALVDAGGPEFAKAATSLMERAAASAVQQALKAMEGTSANMVPVAERTAFIAWRLAERDFKDAVSELRSRPGFEKLSDEQVARIRERADVLVNAAADPRYLYEQAVPDAAMSLYSQQAQAALAQRRAASAQRAYRGSPDFAPPGHTQPARPPQSREAQVARTQAIFERLRAGASPQEARASVDGL